MPPATLKPQPPPRRVQDVKAGLEPHFVENYEEVYKLALDY